MWLCSCVAVQQSCEAVQDTMDNDPYMWLVRVGHCLAEQSVALLG
jgi:hypothetical protein